MADDQEEFRQYVQNFANTLSSEERMLVVLKGELYEGDWNEMIADLKARLVGGPYIFKLANRIDDDLDRIERLCGFEKQHGVDLCEYIKLEPKE